MKLALGCMLACLVVGWVVGYVNALRDVKQARRVLATRNVLERVREWDRVAS